MNQYRSNNPFLFLQEFYDANARAGYEMWRNLVGDRAYDELPALYADENLDVPFESLRVGHSAESTTVVQKWMVLYFASLSGDWNPAHMSKNGVQPFNKPIAHGLIAGSFISALIASKLPGPGSIYRSQTFTFLRPVCIGDILTNRVTITGLDEMVQDISLDVAVSNQAGKVVLKGVALIRKAKR